MSNQLIMHIGSQLEPPQHRVLGFTGIGGLDLVVGLSRVGGDQAIGAEGLELHAVRARGSGSLDQLARQSEVAVMIHARFGDDQSLQVGPLCGGMEVPASQSASSGCAMPIKQRSPILTIFTTTSRAIILARQRRCFAHSMSRFNYSQISRKWGRCFVIDGSA